MMAAVHCRSLSALGLAPTATRRRARRLPFAISNGSAAGADLRQGPSPCPAIPMRVTGRSSSLRPWPPVPRRHGVPLLRAAQQQWLPPPGLSILPWTGDAEQMAALHELQRRMAASAFPACAQDEQTLRWFLQDRKLDVPEAEEKLLKMLRWRREFGADLIQWTDVAREAATGKAFLHSHSDVLGRPVVVVRAAKHITGASSLQDSQRLCVHLMDLALERLAVAEAAARPGTPPPPQTVLGIFDLRGFTSANADWGFVRFLVDIFFLYYPKRLSQVLFVEAPWVFKPGWEIVRPWLKKYAALVRFVSADEVRREFFTVETVPDEFAAQGFPAKAPTK